jgi:hypothetical protein
MWGNIMKTNLTRRTLVKGGCERKQAIMDELDKSINDLEQRFANEEKPDRLEADLRKLDEARIATHEK